MANLKLTPTAKKAAGWTGAIISAISVFGSLGAAYIKSEENEVLLQNNHALVESMIKIAIECKKGE